MLYTLDNLIGCLWLWLWQVNLKQSHSWQSESLDFNLIVYDKVNASHD